MKNRKVSWPAFVKHAGDDELTYYRGQAEWENDTDLPVLGYGAGDRLIDSQGQVFALDKPNTAPLEAGPDDSVLSCPEVTELVRNHFANLNNCCVSKLGPGSIEACMQLLERDAPP